MNQGLDELGTPAQLELPQVEREFQALEHEVDNLQSQIVQLEERLHSVLQCATSTETDPPIPEQEVLVPVADRIHGSRNRVLVMQGHLRDILGRLEI